MGRPCPWVWEERRAWRAVEGKAEIDAVVPNPLPGVPGLRQAPRSLGYEGRCDVDVGIEASLTNAEMPVP